MTRGSWTIVCNGEIYNFREIRETLQSEGITFTSETDTEVMIHAIARWDEEALHRFNGMFAFALWNANDRTLLLARDRLGVKPLYYWHSDSVIIFGSEVQALMHSAKIPPTLDESTLAGQLIATSYVAATKANTLIKDVKCLPPGTLMRIQHGSGHAPSTRTWWALPEADPNSPPESPDPRRLLDLMRDSVRLRLVSDVPVAAFLSGGMDSSVITALAAEVMGASRLITLNIAHEQGGIEPTTGESDTDPYYSQLVADTLGDRVDHRRVPISASAVTLDAIDRIADLATLSDDPRSLSKAANYQCVTSQGVYVVLNGQGADETQGGYFGQPWFQGLWKAVTGQGSGSGSSVGFSPTLDRDPRIFSPSIQGHIPLVQQSLFALFMEGSGSLLQRVHRVLVATALTRILRFEDYISMQASVECRLPFMDYRVIEWAFRIPFEAHVRQEDMMGKMLLRQAAACLLPREVLERPKQVFPEVNPESLHLAFGRLCVEHHQELMNSTIVRMAFDPGLLNRSPEEWPLRVRFLMLILWRTERTMITSAGPSVA